jgi:hypothetical protein
LHWSSWRSPVVSSDMDINLFPGAEKENGRSCRGGRTRAPVLVALRGTRSRVHPCNVRMRPLRTAGTASGSDGTQQIFVGPIWIACTGYRTETIQFVIWFQYVQRRILAMVAGHWFDTGSVLHHVLAANRHLSVTK